VLDQTFNVSELAGKRLTLGHLVSQSLVGGVFSSLTRTYTPYIGIEDNNQGFQGETFQDYLTNFPLATTFTTAEWLEYEIRSPDGHTETFTREVKDLIGAATRRLGGSPQLALDTSSGPFFGSEDIYVNWVLPHAVSEWAAQRQAAGVLTRLKQAGEISQVMLEIANRLPPNAILTGADLDAYAAARADLVFVSEFALTSIGLNFARQADAALNDIEDGLRTRLYYASPRVFTVSSIGTPNDIVTTTVDLRHTSVEAVVYPGQASAAEQTAQWIKGLNESILEGDALAQGQGTAPLTTMRVFDEMTAQGIDPVLIKPNDYGLLDAYDFSPDALAHVIEALLEGKQVLIPSRAVLVDGKPTFAWWEIDPVTNETISVGENGLHPSAMEYRMLQIIVEEFVDEIATGGNDMQPDTVELAESALKIGMTLRGYFFEVAAGIGSSRSPGANLNRSEAASSSGTWRSLPAYLCPTITCGAEQFFLDDMNTGPLPLPELAFVYGSAPGDAVAITTMSASASGGGAPAFTIATNPGSSSITPGTAASFQAQLNSNFADDFMVAVYAPSGWSAAITTTGQISVQPAKGVVPGDCHSIVAQSTLHPGDELRAYDAIRIRRVRNSIVPEPKITVSMGTALIAPEPNETNDGETEGPAATIVSASSGSTRTFVWASPARRRLDHPQRFAPTAATVNLKAGEVAISASIYRRRMAQNAPGTSHPINVSDFDADHRKPRVVHHAAQPFNFVMLIR
jgi:hypothetical protein